MGQEPIFFRFMYRQNQTLVDLMEPVIVALGYQLWGIEQLPGGRDSLLRVYIEHESGIKLEDCVKVSKQVVGVLDVEDPISGSYRLEISSPGLDRPLFTLAQFSRFQGAHARVYLRQKLEGRRRIQGEIHHVDEEAIYIVSEDKDYVILSSLIEKANILPL